MHIVIIGNGISGVTCARWLRKLSDHQITVISSESKHFFSRTALMYVYMGHMRWEDIKPYEDWFWSKNKLDLRQATVTEIEFSNQTIQIDEQGQTSSIQYDKLVLALGSKSNKFGWPGQDLKGVGGLYHKQDLEQMEAFSPGLKRAVIVGGGLIGIEMSEMFLSRKIPVTMLVREQSYWNNVLPPEESAMITKHIKQHHVDLRLGVNLQEIKADGNGKAKAVIIKETQEEISCGYVGLTAGVSPNVAFLKSSELSIEKGIVVDAFLQTNQENVYAIGDCAQLADPKPGRRPIEAIWYTGRMMGETLAYTLTGKPRTYDPGIWFNSAKFFDVEYQVYGEVPTQLPEDWTTLYWEDLENYKAIRINFETKTGIVKGFNLMGIRYRHEVCEKWLAEKTTIQVVLVNLSLANFDPEFVKCYEADLINEYNSKTGESLKLKEKRSLDKVLAFLKTKA